MTNTNSHFFAIIISKNSLHTDIWLHFQITSRVFFGEAGPWFSSMHMDGDKTTIFHDVDGSVSEYPGAFLVKEDNWLLRHPDCIDVPDWRAAICSGNFAQVRGNPHALVTSKHRYVWCQLGFFGCTHLAFRTHASKIQSHLTWLSLPWAVIYCCQKARHVTLCC